MDVKIAFLSIVVEDIYMEQPKWFEKICRDTYVCKMKRDLYGLKEASKAWDTRIKN